MGQKRGRFKIVYLPYPVRADRINEYTVNMVRILQKKYRVAANLAETVDVIQMLQTKAVFLNWVEQQLDNKMKFQLMLYKFWGARIIWVFHNKYPHDIARSDIVKKNMNWLANHSSKIVLHSRSSKKYVPNRVKNAEKTVFIPHILYSPQNKNTDLDNVREHYGLDKNDFVFTMFGIVRPYKNIEGAITAFQKLNLKDAKLLIAGNPIDHKYAKKIVELCKGNQDIILELKYISNTMLDNIIDISDIIVLPYKDGSSINSGVMIQSFSKGKTVIVPNICMAKDLASEKFIYGYRHSLEKVMLKAYRNGKLGNKQMGERAREYIYKNNNKDVVEKCLDGILQ